MSYENILSLLRAIQAGRIRGEASAAVLGITASTFNKWVAEARRRGVKFHTNQRGGARRGKDKLKSQPWTVAAFGPFKIHFPPRSK